MPIFSRINSLLLDYIYDILKAQLFPSIHIPPISHYLIYDEYLQKKITNYLSDIPSMDVDSFYKTLESSMTLCGFGCIASAI